jgi:hypothetical protein
MFLVPLSHTHLYSLSNNVQVAVYHLLQCTTQSLFVSINHLNIGYGCAQYGSHFSATGTISSKSLKKTM